MSQSNTAVADSRVEEIVARGIPETYKAAYVERDDAAALWDKPDKDIRKTLKIGEIPTPELAPDECLVAVMSAAMNYNTVWSAKFEPVPTFVFLHFLGQNGGWDERHNQPYHVLGSDAAVVVVATGSAVDRWSPGDTAVIYPGWGNPEIAGRFDDMVTGTENRAWGFETNFGALADYAVVRNTQLLPKPRHLNWEEAASNMLCGMTAYRMLVSPHGAPFKQGDIVFIWGAAGGLGSYAVQLVKNGGGIPVGVVNSEAKQKLLEELDCDLIIRRDDEELAGLTGKALGKGMREIVRRELGEDPHIVFEHVGAATFPASVYLVRPGGRVVTCGSSTGFEHNFDNRYLWMKAKRIIGSHGSTMQEALEFNRLCEKGMIKPALSSVVGLDDVIETTYQMDRNSHMGKIGVLCMAEEEGEGVEDPEMRERLGEDFQLFRKYG